MNEIKEISALLLQSQGTDISRYEDDFLRKSLDKRLSASGLNTYHDYLGYLKVNKNEADLFLNSLYIAFSEFFRNPITFAMLEQILLPLLIEKKKAGKENEIRVWSAACASGQEAYSFAMLFDEAMENIKANFTCRIFATDINQAELTNAKQGIYHTASIHKVILKRVQKYFTQQNDNYIITPKLREYIDFSVFDLLTQQGDSPPASIYGNFDFIFCSNVLFYYKPEFRAQILEKLSNSLATGGYLITGETEREIVKNNNYREVFVNSGIFQKINYVRGKNV